MFLLANMQAVGLSYEDTFLHGSYWGAIDAEERIQGVLAHYWNGNIIVQAPNETAIRALIETFQQERVRPLAGMLGPNSQVQTLIRDLKISEDEFAISRSEGLYALSLNALLVPEHTAASVRCVPITETQRALVESWMRAYEIEALGSEDSDTLDRDVKERTRRMINSERHRLLWVDDTPVSLCGRNASLETVVQIGPVWTPPKHRRCGYARLVVALFLEELKSQGIDEAVLFTDNPHAILAYEAIGFTCVGDFNLSLLKEARKEIVR